MTILSSCRVVSGVGISRPRCPTGCPAKDQPDRGLDRLAGGDTTTPWAAGTRVSTVADNSGLVWRRRLSVAENQSSSSSLPAGAARTLRSE